MDIIYKSYFIWCIYGCRFDGPNVTPFSFYNQNDRGQVRNMRNLLFLRCKADGRNFQKKKRGERKEKKNTKTKYLNEREEEESKRDTIRRPPPFLFADTIKSRLHLITTRGDVTNGLSSSRKGRLLFFFYIYLSDEWGKRRWGHERRTWWLRHFYIYNSTVCLNDPSSSPRLQFPFRQFHIAIV